jgi:hypothetical protein
VADLIDFLARHLTWLCAHEIAAEFAQEIAQLVGKARRSAQPDGGRRRVRVGGCVERDCPGDLVAMALPHESLGEIVCSADLAHRWAAREWLRLSRRLDRPTTPAEPAPADAAAAHEPHPKTRSTWLTATEVARLWRLPTGSVYRLASEHKWPRRTNAGRTFYDAAYVERTFAARAARSA